MRPSNTIGKHTAANSHAHTICEGKICRMDSSLSLESSSDLFEPTALKKKKRKENKYRA